jgi:hypothetical protein
MRLRFPNSLPLLLLPFTFASILLPMRSEAATCKTQSQMTAAERVALSTAARTMADEVQKGDVQDLRANTIPSVASDFTAIAGLVEKLKPLVQEAAITVDSLYSLDASMNSAGVARTDFYCGTPLVVLNFTDLPPGIYALVILHATGVPKPQQISLILSGTTDKRWMLAGLFIRPMIEAGHDGLWYWASAREYTQKKMNWNALFYYRVADYLLEPVQFLTSPNIEKLRGEEDRVRPEMLPGEQPMMLDTKGVVFKVTTIDATDVLGPLDLEVHYTPDTAQTLELRDPPSARKQVTKLMTALREQHPELQEAFHGIWLYADDASGTIFSLELPMDETVPKAPEPQATLKAKLD